MQSPWGSAQGLFDSLSKPSRAKPQAGLPLPLLGHRQSAARLQIVLYTAGVYNECTVVVMHCRRVG